MTKIENLAGRLEDIIKARVIKIKARENRNRFKYLKTKHSWHLVDPSP
jgi:hypothetical protein